MTLSFKLQILRRANIEESCDRKRWTQSPDYMIIINLTQNWKYCDIVRIFELKELEILPI